MSQANVPIPPKYCPYLGLSRDKVLVVDHPTDAHVCHAQGSAKRRFGVIPVPRPYKRISLEIQEHVCQTDDNWHNCPAYRKRMKAEGSKG